MKKTKTRLTFCLIMATSFAFNSAQAGSITHFDITFNGGTQALEVWDSDWTVGDGFNIDANGAFTSSDNASASLAFTFETDRIYTLDVRASANSGNSIGMGFSTGLGGTRLNSGGGAIGRGWMLYNGNAETGTIFPGAGAPATGGQDLAIFGEHIDENGGLDMRIVLDTRPEDHHMTWYIKGIDETEWTQVWSQVPAQTSRDSISLTVSNSNVTGKYDSLSLTSIPEPSAYALIGGILALGFVGFRRLRR